MERMLMHAINLYQTPLLFKPLSHNQTLSRTVLHIHMQKLE